MITNGRYSRITMLSHNFDQKPATTNEDKVEILKVVFSSPARAT